MLQKVAGELGWKRQSKKMKNLGSTWVVKSERFSELVRKTAYASDYVYNNCFNVSRFPEIKPWMENNPTLGSWPQWWRPVCSMYGGDLAIQHLFKNLTEEVNHPPNTLDVYSGNPQLIISEVKHIHAFHHDDKFSKFNFYKSVPGWCENFTSFYANTKRLSQLGRFSPTTLCVDYAGNVSQSGALEYIIQHGCQNLY